MAAPGGRHVDLTFEGRAAHSGISPELGISAIQAAAVAISNMRLGRLDAETTANVGVIEGGTQRNVVPERCLVRAEVRSRSSRRLAEELEHMLACAGEAAARFDCRLETTARGTMEPYRHRRNDLVVALAREALEAAGYAPREEQVGGGADAHVLQAAGIPSIVLSSGMLDVHTPGEHIHAEDIHGLARLTVELIRAAARRL